MTRPALPANVVHVSKCVDNALRTATFTRVIASSSWRRRTTVSHSGSMSHLLALLALGAPSTTNITVYRITPRNYTGLTNLDSGDGAGDVFFGLYEFALPIICAASSPDRGLVNCQNVPILSIPDFNVYTEFEIEVDERFGEYAGCNPDPNTGQFSCR